jgi:hypothetical protein
MANKINKTIRGHEYEIMALPPIPCQKLFTKFMSTIGDSFECIFGALDNKGDSIGKVGKGVAILFKSLHANDPNCDLTLELLSQTTRGGKAINRVTIDLFYTGNIEEMREALIESIKFHFKGFLPIDQFSGLLSALGVQTIESSEL